MPVPKPEPGDFLVDLAGMAKRFGVKRGTPKRWRARGVLPPVDVPEVTVPLWWASTLRDWGHGRRTPIEFRYELPEGEPEPEDGEDEDDDEGTGVPEVVFSGPVLA